jgi:hypothetical protein
MTNGQDTRGTEDNPVNVRIHTSSLRNFWDISISLTPLIALIFSGIAVWYTYTYYFRTGSLKTLPITASSIMRGYETNQFPSDHLIIQIEWVNDNGPPAIVIQPRLILKKIGNKGNEAKENPLKFFVAGHYSEISDQALKRPFIQSQSYLIEGHSAKQFNLVFHIENWYEKTDPDAYCFVFEPQTDYSVTLRFLDEKNKWHDEELGTINTYDVDCFIQRVKNKITDEICKKQTEKKKCLKYQRWWDYHPIELNGPQ